MAIQDQINSLKKRKEELYKFTDIASKKNDSENFEKKSQENGFWDNPKEAEILLKKLSTLKSWITSYELIETNI